MNDWSPNYYPFFMSFVTYQTFMKTVNISRIYKIPITGFSKV